jgi:hypothetical protein
LVEEIRREKGMSRNFKMRALESRRGIITKGKVYEFVNGVAMLDSGMSNNYESVEDFQKQNKTMKVEEVRESKPVDGNFKVKCIKSRMPGNWFTEGNIYEFKNGILTYDSGFTGCRYENFAQYCRENPDLGECLKLISDNKSIERIQKITVKQKGRKVIAILSEDGKFIKAAKARYNPNDAAEGKPFDFEVGKKLAIKRLLGEDVKNVEVKLDGKTIIKAVGEAMKASTRDIPLTANEFKVGDTVISTNDKWVAKGTKGKIKRIDHDHMPYRVDFEGSGLWWCHLKDIERFETTPLSFDWPSFKSGKFAVHCDTEEKAREFLKECDAQGIKWSSGASCLGEVNWKYYKEKTCYEFFYGFGYGDTSTRLPIIDYIPTEPTVKEVSRQGKVGEYIKLLENKSGCSTGDICKVDHLTTAGDCGVYAIKPSGEISLCICNKYYVVLEGYVPEDKPIEKPTVKEVKRPAEAGEWIKIVAAYHLTAHEEAPEYRNGDILMVSQSTDGRVRVKHVGEYIEHREYVVLENYQPPIDSKPEEPKPLPSTETPKPFRKAKVGETVKIIKIRKQGHGPDIEIGDVHKITYVERNNVSTDKNNVLWDEDQEYIILEGPKPNFKKAKVGDKIKVVKVNCYHVPNVKLGDIKTVDYIGLNYVSTNNGNAFHDKDQEYIIIEETKPEVKPEPKPETIEVGDTVKVINNGNGYTTYPKWFDDFAPEFSSRYAYGQLVKDGYTGKVVAKHKHKDYSDILYAIQYGEGAVYLVGEKGIEKVK